MKCEADETGSRRKSASSGKPRVLLFVERRGSAVGKKGAQKDAGRELKGVKSEATPWDGNRTEYSVCVLSAAVDVFSI